MITQTVSELTLCVTAFAVFLVFFQKQSIYSRLLWGLFLITLSLTALLSTLNYLGWDAITPVLRSVKRLENTLGPVCMLAGTWFLINHSVPSRQAFWGTVGVGIGLYFGLVWYRMESMIQVVQPLCIVISMMIACWGLLLKQKSALWIIFAMTILALSSKLRLSLDSQFAFEPYELLVAISTFCLGKAMEFEHATLFK
ncbi:hypothetical protein [Arundinibacter roseus]|uniref:Uncharacterized protein n=1 Tax=Arundinibacter roseus TaxID=2070510 RepID=A0A4R4KBG2_9BACT|nr:hypothetical protein [Arundinibacter roseus]TDB65130.1 hypothetical protein EZE20_10480 [Arundinibacter roseus]